MCGTSAAACSDRSGPFVNLQPLDTTRANPGEAFIPPVGTATTVPTRKTATGHPIQYWVSVPKGWPGNRTWPVVIAIAGSGRDYEAHGKLFSRVRDENNYPFIIVSPVVLTNSGDGAVPRTHPAFQYPSSTWDLIDRDGRCAFDLTGMAAIAAELRAQFAGQSKPLLTGFSGGGNTLWAVVLVKPELLRAAAPVATNYLGRCVTAEAPAAISNAPERVQLPVRIFNGADDSFLPFGRVQQQVAMDLARSNGFTNVSTVTMPGIGHDPQAATVLAYFYSMLAATER